MKIKIAHLYSDLMNLYGEVGNIKALVKTFLEQNIDCVVDKFTIGDKMNLSKYDIIYMGQGSEENQMIVLEDILKHKETLENAILNNKYVICTGNSYELFGKYIEKNGKKHKCLNIFDYYSGMSDDFFYINTTSTIGSMVYIHSNSGILKEASVDEVKPVVPVISINRPKVIGGKGLIDDPYLVE